MTRAWLGRLVFAASVFLPAAASAQSAPTEPSGWWLEAGGGATTILGDCTNCEITNYRHTGSYLAGGGISPNSRLDLGGEIVWIPSTTATTAGRIRTTLLTAVVEFRPWQKGFFFKASSGMAFVRNWLIEINGDPPPVTSKAFTIGIGAGWDWRVSNRFSAQVFGVQHAVALGDLTTGETTVENVMGNFWSVGAAVVIR